MCKEIDYLNKVITDYDISLTWLAKQIGNNYTKQRLFYIFNSGKEISTTTYKLIRDVLDKYNFVSSDFDECGRIAKATAILNEESAHLVNTAIEAIEDKVLTESEKADIQLQIAKIEQRIIKLKEIIFSQQKQES